MKKVFTSSPLKRLVSTTVKSAKPVLIFAFEDQNGQSCFLAVSVGKQDQSQLRKRKTMSFSEKFLRQSQSSAHEPEPKKDKNHFSYSIIVLTRHWLIQIPKIS